MASITVVIVEGGKGYYLSNENSETEESVDWGEPLEFDGVTYLADVDETGDVVSLSKVVELPEDSFEVTSEGDENSEGEDSFDAAGE